MSVKVINWLVEKVNELLDQGCGCNECSLGTSFLPMFVTWGKQGITEFGQGIQTTQAFTKISEEPTLTEYTGDYELLKISFPTEVWNEIQDKQPTLLLDRYRPKSHLGSSDKTRKAGYRHEPDVQAQANGRLSEILLTQNNQYVDFKIDEYFVINEDNDVRAKGFPLNRSRTNNTNAGSSSPGAFFNFGLRLRLTDGSQVSETNYLGYFKAVFHYNKNIPLQPALITYRPI